MALNLAGMCTVLDSDNAEELAAFYEKLLGWAKFGSGEFITVANPAYTGFPTWITIQQVDDYTPPTWPATPGKQQQMAHLDFHVEDMEEGVQHALACGARLSEIQLEEEFRVMLDPAGHPFCILPIPGWMQQA
ncbi:VOC family protein [Eubacteriales bacterium OttesenSCG-928-N14]|nr:VOC family protein [Eubacteriales bacterium OttesenSCG-928-N14]